VLVSGAAAICTGTGVAGRLDAISGPSSFPGTADIYPASSVSGIFTHIFGAFSAFIIDPSYIFGTPIISSAMFNGTTLANIGLTPTSGLLGTWTITAPAKQSM
jgi:hypothetical protein